MAYWWVNQNQTYAHEVPGGYLWSPKTKKNGHRNPFYDNMTRAQPGDVVLSYAGTLIRAIGVVQSSVATAPKPTEFGSVGEVAGITTEVEPVELTGPTALNSLIGRTKAGEITITRGLTT